MKAQKYFDMGCEFKSNESCDLALKHKNGTMPEKAEDVLPGVEVSSYETQLRAFAGHTLLAYAVNTCPGPVSDVELEQAENIKAYGRKHYPSIRAQFHEYWTSGMGMYPGRDKRWYVRASRNMNLRPGMEDTGVMGWLLSE